MDWITNLLVFLLFLLLSGLTVKARLLNKPAAASGALLAWLIWLGTGVTGVLSLALFFICGAGATRWKKKVKRQWVTENHKNKADRSASQVWANGGMAGLGAVLSILFPECKEEGLLIVVAVLAAACSDTLSSELGTLYGRRFFNSLTGKPDQRGADGVVSLEGFVFGLIGSVLIALIYGFIHSFGWQFAGIVLAGLLGNLSDSFFGAALQRKGVLNNDWVNVLNTIIAAVSMILLSIAFS
jgi:uncharacterized protein (TIGR00297 family)